MTMEDISLLPKFTHIHMKNQKKKIVPKSTRDGDRRVNVNLQKYSPTRRRLTDNKLSPKK